MSAMGQQMHSPFESKWAKNAALERLEAESVLTQYGEQQSFLSRTDLSSLLSSCAG